jgi:hypothetical protein
LAEAVQAKQCELALESFGRYNETATAESRLNASRLHMHPMVRLAKFPQRMRWSSRDHIVEQLRSARFPSTDVKHFCRVTHDGDTVWIAKFNFEVPDLMLRDAALAKKDLDKCHSAVDAQFANLERCLDSKASDGDRHRASAVLDRLLHGDGVSAAFRPPAVEARKTAPATELAGCLSLRLPPRGDAEHVEGQQPLFGVRLDASSRAFGAGAADEAVDDGACTCAVDCAGACTCAADASDHAQAVHADAWTRQRLVSEPRLMDAIRLAVRDHAQAALRRSSLSTHRVELRDVYIRKVSHVVPRKRDPRLTVDFTVCMVPDSVLSTFDGATAVFDGDAILATARVYHQREHDTFIAELKGDHATAIEQHRQACTRDYSREDATGRTLLQRFQLWPWRRTTAPAAAATASRATTTSSTTPMPSQARSRWNACGAARFVGPCPR